MVDKKNYVVFDFETSSTNRETTQILSVGAVALDRNSLKVKDEFYSLCKPEDKDSVEEGALKVNKLTLEELESAPDITIIFPQFCEWLKKFNVRKDKSTFGSPIGVGWNIGNFDLPILNRYCKRFGFWDDKWNNQTVLNPVFCIDCMQLMWLLVRNNEEVQNVKIGDILNYMGIDKNEVSTGGHNSLWDSQQCSKIAVKLIQMFDWVAGKKDDGLPRLRIKGCLGG